MADFVVLYDSDSGVVSGLWPRATSDNCATMIADGFLEVDGVRVADGMDTSTGAFTPAAAVITDPTFTDTAAPPGVARVDDEAAPSDVSTRSDGGRWPDYPYAP